METRVASLEAIIASLPSLIATAIDNALEKAFEKAFAKAFDASLVKFRREMLSRGAGEGISSPLAGDHHASPAIDPIQLPRSPICAEGARSHLSDDQLPRIDLDEEDNFACVSELLESVDKVTDDDDSDDVVVISEVNSKPSPKSSKRTVADDDDDCVVLDGDPDKPISVVEDSGSGSDELLVVGETGQVACRDYPHPRHLCAKFPFKTTRPENHCNLAFEKAFAKAFDASLEKFRREMLSRGAGEGISAPLAGDHHASPAIDPIQLPRSPICAEGARSHLSDNQLPRIDLDEEDNFDCVSELLESVDKVTDDDDSDDVVVISEVDSKPSPKSSKRTVADDDDDCVVLDGDPDKPVSVVEDSGSGSDELLVVGETGQVACRDYPHPRHLCAKFPFKTTQHENHCDLCHCYVCDSLAPCVHWSTGGSIFNHCHATDKEVSWRILRKKIQDAENS